MVRIVEAKLPTNKAELRDALQTMARNMLRLTHNSTARVISGRKMELRIGTVQCVCKRHSGAFKPYWTLNGHVIKEDDLLQKLAACWMIAD